jgi:hypothetical protein
MSSLSAILTLTVLLCFCNLVSADKYVPYYGGFGGLAGLVSITKFKEIMQILFF